MCKMVFIIKLRLQILLRELNEGGRKKMTIKHYLSKDTATKTHHKHWQFCVGSGHAALALRTDYVKQLKFIVKELGIKRVRFHGMFHEDMHTIHDLTDVLPVPGGEKFKERSFHYCGLVIDNLLECGVQPFVELGFMPSKLAKEDKKGMFFYKPNISMPRDDAEWCEYIRDFINYLINRYGIEEVRQWYFEVWNEPDLQVAFFNGTQADYFHLYEITARTIKHIDSQLMVGGPSTSSSKWVEAFVNYCENNNVPVDFVTTHQYAGDPLGGVEDQGGPMESSENRQSNKFNEEAFKKAFENLKEGTVLQALRHFLPDKSEIVDLPNDLFIKNSAVVKNQAKGLPVFYTEWNANANFSAYTNDTRKVAAYDVKSSLAIEENVAGSSIWTFSDIFEELHPFLEEFHGGFGMLSLNGIPKPVFYGMKILANAGEERYVLPGALDKEVGMAAFKGEGEIQLILLRQNMKNLQLPKEEVEVTVEVHSTPKEVILQRIDDEHCNPLKLWEDMGSPKDMTPKEVKDIISKTMVQNESMEFFYEDGKVTLKAALGVNDLYFIRIIL